MSFFLSLSLSHSLSLSGLDQTEQGERARLRLRVVRGEMTGARSRVVRSWKQRVESSDGEKCPEGLSGFGI
ncbi:hypothetical protein KFK09_017451 [Dendrobium nobile]|uniref:Uncharacterized protein n=1 Tax=Dendrobium nobile TaxID=94219 RepID=A0A8T3B312_DENNO|nr:hypothetical protein KFK09_017451 [Dendrobium nobile]